MGDMIERIARALQRDDWFDDPEGADAAWADTSLGDAYQRSYRRNARIAIEMMREPTEAMLDCFAGTSWKALPKAKQESEMDAYKAMIAVALKD